MGSPLNPEKNIFNNRITQLFNIKYPIIQAGMVWTSGWKLAHAVSVAGGLGIIGAGSLSPELLDIHLTKYYSNTSLPLAVNLPLLYSNIEKQIEVIIKHKVPIVFTSAGNPHTFTKIFQNHQIKVVHVVGSLKFAMKAEEANCDAIVCEGFEAGGHNSREETTSLCLLPNIAAQIKIPLMAAGGFATGKQMLAAFVLGAEGVQFGTRFACSIEASCHKAFKEKIISAKEGDTKLSMKKHVPVRLLKNEFAEIIWAAENKGADKEELKNLLGHGRAKLGMFEGDMNKGELEIGQICSMINEIKPAADIVKEIWTDFQEGLIKVNDIYNILHCK